jgi:hypothetical protein
MMMMKRQRKRRRRTNNRRSSSHVEAWEILDLAYNSVQKYAKIFVDNLLNHSGNYLYHAL